MADTADRKKILERVKALIARSSSDSEEEARTSAVIACKLIREHDLEVRFPGDEKPAPKKKSRQNGVRAESASVNSGPFRTRTGNPFGHSPDETAFWEEIFRKSGIGGVGKPPEDFVKDYRRRVEEEQKRQAKEMKRREEENRKRAAEAERKKREAEAARKRDFDQRQKEKFDARPCPTNQPSGPMYRKGDINWMAVPADFPGKCSGCDRDYEEGDAVAWARGFGVYRTECLEDKTDDFLLVATQPEMVDEGTPETKPSESAKPPFWAKHKVWTKLYQSAFDSTCRKCGQRVYKGVHIRWVRGCGSYHCECWDAMGDDDEVVVEDIRKALTSIRRDHRDEEWKKLAEKWGVRDK